MDDKVTPQEEAQIFQGEILHPDIDDDQSKIDHPLENTQDEQHADQQTMSEVVEPNSEITPQHVHQVPAVNDDDEQVDMSDVIIPRVKLIQAMSPEAKDGLAKPGDIVDSIGAEKVGDTFTVLFYRKHWIRFNPRNKHDPAFDSSYEPGQLIYRTDNPLDEQLNAKRAVINNQTGEEVYITDKDFGPNNEKPRATVFMSFMCMFQDYDMPIVLSFCNTSLKAGKKLYTNVTMKPPSSLKTPYAYTYKLSSKEQVTDGNSYFVYEVSNAGKSQGDFLEQAKLWHKLYAPHKDSIAQGEIVE